MIQTKCLIPLNIEIVLFLIKYSNFGSSLKWTAMFQTRTIQNWNSNWTKPVKVEGLKLNWTIILHSFTLIKLNVRVGSRPSNIVYLSTFLIVPFFTWVFIVKGCYCGYCCRIFTCILFTEIRYFKYQSISDTVSDM